MTPTVSIIIVQYHCISEFVSCIRSIEATTPKNLYEIIVVDNDEHKTLPSVLHQEKLDVTYIPNDNKGFGQACNLGARQARGDYLFLLNPDTIVHEACIENLVHFLDTHTDHSVAPVLLSPQEVEYPLQGTSILTPIKAFFSTSFISKLFPHNPIAQTYWNLINKKKEVYDVDVLPGTAFLMRKNIFESLGGFDEQFFLYFEENDLFRRASLIHQHQSILAKAKVTHLWGKSTAHNTKSYAHFLQSRYRYFKKWYGTPIALLTEGFLRFGSTEAILTGIIVFGAILRLINLGQTPFFGDMGWFYVFARDALLSHTIPLTGITSSHTWLTQGPLWTYIVMLCFALTKFNPYSPILFTGAINMLALIVLFIVSKSVLNKSAALMTTAFAAFSPLLIMHSRTAYHTNLIFPVSLLFLWSVLKLRDKSVWFLPLLTFSLGLLYNLEIATITFLFAFIVFAVLEAQTRRQIILAIKNSQVLLTSIFALVIPLLPFLIYNVQTKFHEMTLMIAWVGYKLVFFIPNLVTGKSMSDPALPFIAYSLTYLRTLLFLPSSTIAAILFVCLHVLLLFLMLRAWSRKTSALPETVLIAFYFVPLILYCLNHIPSEGYTPMLFSGFALSIGYLFMKAARFGKVLFLVVFSAITIANLFFFCTNHFLTTPQFYGYSLTERTQLIHKALNQTRGKSVRIIYQGPLDIFPSNHMNYEFLAWQQGAQIDNTHPQKKIVILDTGNHLMAHVQ